MKEINGINTKKQRYFGRNTIPQMLSTALLKARANWKYCFIAFVWALHCKRLKYSVQKREIYCFLSVRYILYSILNFDVIIMEINVAEINSPLN